MALLAVVAVALGTIAYRATRPAELKPLIRLDANLGPNAVAGADVAISPDGTRIVYPIRGADGKPLLATRLLDQSAITPLPGTENGRGVFFSPDGQWIGFFADNKIKKVSLRGGAPVTLSDAVSFYGASWGENGDIVVSIFAVGALQSVPASGGLIHSATSLGQGEQTTTGRRFCREGTPFCSLRQKQTLPSKMPPSRWFRRRPAQPRRC